MNEKNNELYEKISHLQWLWHKHHMRYHAEGGPMADTTRGQGRILAILKMQDGIPTKDLSYLLGIRVSSLNELLAKMEKNGYIAREPSESDKRVMIVKLTEKGKKERQKEWNPGDIFSCLNDEEQNTLGEYFDRIIEAFTAQLGEESDDGAFEWMNAARERLSDDATSKWMNAARERFGENFEELMAMRRGGNPFPFGRGFDPRGGFGQGGFGPQGGFGQQDGLGPQGGFDGFPHGGRFGCKPKRGDDTDNE